VKNRISIYTVIASLGGLALLLVAAMSGSSAVEHTLLGNSEHSLSWGVGLFRGLLIFHGLVLLLVAYLAIQKTDSRPTQTSQTRSNTKSSIWWMLVLLSAIAFGLRIWRLGTDLWFDELLTLLNYVRLPAGYIVSRLPDQNNHILFSLMSHASIRIFGESAWALRLPSVLFGVASIWALFLLGRRVLSTREALLASALMTVSYHHIWFSQNARGYMGLLFFSLLATWLWLEGLERQKWVWWFCYSLAVVGGMWTHLTMAFVVAAHALVYLIVLVGALAKGQIKQAHLWQPLVALTLAATLTLQFYSLALPEFLTTGLHEVSLESEWTNPWWVVTETLRNLRIGFSGLVVVIGGLAMVSVGWWLMMRRDWKAGLLMVLPALLAGGIMLALGHNLWPRFFFFCMGFGLLVAIHGATSLPRFLSGLVPAWPRLQTISPAVGFVLASLLIVASMMTVPRNYAYPKQDYSGARDFVESQRKANDMVVAVGLAGVAYKSYFAPTWSVAQTESELDALRHGNKTVWLIYTLPVEVKAYRPDVWQTIQKDFSVVRVFPGTLGGGEIVVCRQIQNDDVQVAMSF